MRDPFLLMRKIINYPGEGNGQLTRLPQSKGTEFGQGGKCEGAFEELERLPHGRAGVVLSGPHTVRSPRPWGSELASAPADTRAAGGRES